MKNKGYIIATLAYSLAILALSLKPVSPVADEGILFEVFWNFMHAPVYAFLAFLILKSFTPSNVKIYVLAFFITVIYGILNELVQSFVPGRSPSLMDVGLNTIGAASVLTFIYSSKISY